MIASGGEARHGGEVKSRVDLAHTAASYEVFRCADIRLTSRNQPVEVGGLDMVAVQHHNFTDAQASKRY